MHFSGCAEKWCFQSENGMETSLPPPSPSKAAFAKWGLCFEIFEAHRRPSFCFFRFAVLFFASISPIFFMSRVHSQAALSSPRHLEGVGCQERAAGGLSRVLNPVIFHFLGGKMCSELKLSVETFCFFHKSGFIIYGCEPWALPCMGRKGEGSPGAAGLPVNRDPACTGSSIKSSKSSHPAAYPSLSA